MKIEIWRVLTQILCYKNDSIEIIKPFFENLKDENINDKKFIPLLKTFSKYQLKALYKNKILTEETFNLLTSMNKSQNQNLSLSKLTNLTTNDDNNSNGNIEKIISEDNIK